jgi:hypothetical protein
MKDSGSADPVQEIQTLHSIQCSKLCSEIPCDMQCGNLLHSAYFMSISDETEFIHTQNVEHPDSLATTH